MFPGGTKLLLAGADNCRVLPGSSSGRFLIQTSPGLLHGFCFYFSRRICIERENVFLVALVQICFELLCSQGNSATFRGELATLPEAACA